MILKTSILLVSINALINGVASASFSKVFVQNGQEVVPVEYIQYGSPAVPLAGPQIAQISAAPVGSVVPVPSNLAPCGTPCVYPGQAIASFAPIAPPRANYITYNSPISNVPVVVTPNKELPTGYEYAYTVYDESTGDNKQQRELSDGSVVWGQYSFVQPDGFIREVQYLADDTKGFNAIVKNFLPDNVEDVKKVKHTETKDPAPCHENKNEPLKIAPESHENHNEELSEHQHSEKSSEEKHEENSHEQESHEGQKKLPQEEHVHIGSHEELKEVSTHEENTPIEAHEVQTIEISPETDNTKSQDQNIEVIPQESHEEVPSHEDRDDKPSDEHHAEESVEPHKAESTEESHTEPLVEHQAPEANVLVPYNDIIRCVQAAINGANEATSAHKSDSPLTYIVLNKPC